jgi:ABC-type polysaccharide/polyol phosphate export permease
MSVRESALGMPELPSEGQLPPEPQVYDSAVRIPPLVGELRNMWEYRRLIRLLVTRDVLLRYKRSLLGVWWTLLNPLLTTAVLWLVFSGLFHFRIGGGGVPFVVYLLSGVIVVLCFQQAVEAVATSIVLNYAVLTKVYVPPEVFSVSAGLAAAVNLGLGTIPLVLLQLAMGVGIPWTVVLLPLPVVALLAFTIGAGLVVASIAVRFPDMLDFNRVILVIIGYMTPTFYPLSIVPRGFRHVIEANPVFHDLVFFRGLVYEGVLPSWQTCVWAFGSGFVALAVGLWVFARSWRTAVVMM